MAPAPTPRIGCSQRGRSGDRERIRALVDPFRPELHAHCYRMLASVHDAEDALQETLLRAWRALARFEGRSSLRSWLYTIATNTSLNLIAKRPKRVLPVDYGPRTDPRDGPGEPVVESIWIEPYPDERLAAAATAASPEAPYDSARVDRAGVRRRAPAPSPAPACGPDPPRGARILRQGGGRRPRHDRRIGQQRAAARAQGGATSGRPEQTQQQTLRAIGDERARRASSAATSMPGSATTSRRWWRCSTEDAAIAMPPLRTWFGGSHEEFARFLELWPLSGKWHWKTRRARGPTASRRSRSTPTTRSSATTSRSRSTCSASGASKVCDVVAFVARATDLPARASYERWPDRPADPDWMQVAFGQFGLPDRL